MTVRSVLMTADTVGGVWTYALELADALAVHGVEVTLATLGPRPTADQRAELERSSVVACHEGDFALEWMDDPWGDVDRAGSWLLGLERDVRPDIVHLNGYSHGDLPWRSPTVAVAHSCVASWWRAVRREPAPSPQWNEYRRRVAAGLGAVDEVVAPTAAMLRALQWEHGIPRGRVVPNGRSSHWVRLLPKEPVVLTAGRVWDEAKNVGALARVASRLTWPVVVAGDGANVILPGVRNVGRLGRNEMATWLGKASVFALPARYEPFGLAVLEAALAGCALVVGDLPSLREVWGDAAIFVDPDDDDALVDALEHLARDPRARTRLADQARKRATVYTPAAMAAGYLDVYGSVGVPA
jgi:glycogen synthase